MKQRLIGAVVIVALAVIIIPMLLDGSGNKSVRDMPPAPAMPAQGTVDQHNIPLPPQEPSGTVMPQPQAAPPPTADAGASAAVPAVPSTVAPAAPAAPASVAPAPATVTPPPAAPTASAPPAAPPPAAESSTTKPTAKVASGWVVQVGSFSEQSKAFGLRDKLRKSKFSAYVERFSNGSKQTMYRVRVGPEIDRAKAEAVQKRLHDEYKLSGFVTRNS